MKKELDEKLQDTFAWLKGLELHVDKACEFVKGYTLCENYGFEVGDGWYKLLFDLCIRIEEIYKEYNQNLYSSDFILFFQEKSLEFRFLILWVLEVLECFQMENRIH